MRSKTKRTAWLVSFAAMLCLLLPFWFPRGETVSAATTPSYTVAFDYTHTYTYGSGAGTRKETSGDNNVYSAVVQSGSNTTATISVIMYLRYYVWEWGIGECVSFQWRHDQVGYGEYPDLRL